MTTLRGDLILPGRVLPGELVIEGPRIAHLRPNRRRNRCYIAPGCMDLHVWGEPSTVAQQEPAGGTTSFLTAVGPLPVKRLCQRLSAWSAETAGHGARRLGFHLEGPWVNPRQAGALEARACRPSRLAEARRLWTASRGQIRFVTVAPECVSKAFVQWWRRHGATVSCGHTSSSYEEAKRGMASGIRCATHLWNKMGSPHQRRPGTIGACLEDPRVMIMLLVDGKHLHPTTVKLLYRLIGAARLVLVTDSTRTLPLASDAAVGLRRGQFRGQLAGTRLTMMDAVKNLVAFTGASLPEAVRAASLNPATVLGLQQRTGSVAVGKEADLVIFDRQFRVLQTIVGGRVIYERG